MISYTIPGSDQTIKLTDDVLAHFLQNRQLKCWHREAGGQLFAELSNHEVLVTLATGPYREDKRSKWLFIPNRTSEQRDIYFHHSSGLHYVGDWHTHPQQNPHYSSQDRQTLARCFATSTHHLNAFILVIVGRLPPPEGLEISLHNSNAASILHPIGSV